ncbi:MAG: hypothetical protein N3B10_02630 [Armatimonadetes bacterium]|nr:hypothetical protein [Armatimonadota bacterium]
MGLRSWRRFVGSDESLPEKSSQKSAMRADFIRPYINCVTPTGISGAKENIAKVIASPTHLNWLSQETT